MKIRLILMRFIAIAIVFLFTFLSSYAANYVLKGSVVNREDRSAVEFAYVMLPDLQLRAITNEKGEFVVKGVSQGELTYVVNCLGAV